MPQPLNNIYSNSQSNPGIHHLEGLWVSYSAFQESYTRSEYGAGMEQINAEREEQEFDFVAETRTEDALHSRTGNYLSLLNPLTGKPLGPMKWLKVEKGDTVSMKAYCHYDEAQVQGSIPVWQQGLAGFLTGSLLNSLYAQTLENGTPNPAYQQLILLGSTLAALGLGNSTQTDPMVPRAYMKWIHYDKDSQFISQGIMPVTNEAKDSYELLELMKVAEEDGFIQFFVANESLKDVYFDDISGLVRKPKIIQEGHYNPFGLPLAGLTTLGSPEYAYFFTGKELYEDEALQWYDYRARMYDAQIGRWTTHDPLYQDASPYAFCGNNAVNFRDPDGRWFGLDDLFVAGFGFVLGYGINALTTGDFGWKSVKMGLVGAVATWLTVNTCGAATAAGLSPMAGGILGGAAGGAVGGAYGGYEIGRAKGASGFADWASYIGSGMTIGAVAGGVGGAVGVALQPLEGAIGGFIQGAATGFSGGFLGGAGFASLGGGDPLQGGWDAAWRGALIGGTIAGAAKGYRAMKEGRDFWTGTKRTVKSVHVDYQKIFAEEGDCVPGSFAAKEGVGVDEIQNRFGPGYKKGQPYDSRLAAEDLGYNHEYKANNGPLTNADANIDFLKGSSDAGIMDFYGPRGSCDPPGHQVLVTDIKKISWEGNMWRNSGSRTIVRFWDTSTNRSYQVGGIFNFSPYPAGAEYRGSFYFWR